MIDRKIIEHPAPMIRSERAVQFPMTVSAGATLGFTLTEAVKGPCFEDGANTTRIVYTWTSAAQYAGITQLMDDLNRPVLRDGVTPNPFRDVMHFTQPTEAFRKGLLEAHAFKATHYDAALVLDETPASIAPAMYLKPKDSDEQLAGGFRNPVAWSLWAGAACMVTSGLLTFALQWRTVLRAFSGLLRIFSKKKQDESDPLVRVEVPGSWFAAGMIFGTIGIVWLANACFGIPIWMALLAVLLSFFLALVACRACGETDTTPVGAMGKITQLTFGAIAPRQMNTNLMTACITAGVADSASDLLTDLKSGYVLGANARRQFLAQFSGIFMGTAVTVPTFFLIVPNVSVLGSAKFPAPAAQVWAGVARLLSNGLESLHPTARIALLIGGLVGILIPLANIAFPKARKWIPSAMGLGLSFVLPFYNSLSMFIGGVIALVYMKLRPKTAEQYTIASASGIIAGESLMGIFITLLGVVLAG
jgi:hypothetical protein